MEVGWEDLAAHARIEKITMNTARNWASKCGNDIELHTFADRFGDVQFDAHPEELILIDIPIEEFLVLAEVLQNVLKYEFGRRALSDDEIERVQSALKTIKEKDGLL